MGKHFNGGLCILTSTIISPRRIRYLVDTFCYNMSDLFDMPQQLVFYYYYEVLLHTKDWMKSLIFIVCKNKNFVPKNLIDMIWSVTHMQVATLQTKLARPCALARDSIDSPSHLTHLCSLCIQRKYAFLYSCFWEGIIIFVVFFFVLFIV